MAGRFNVIGLVEYEGSYICEEQAAKSFQLELHGLQSEIFQYLERVQIST